MLEQHSNLVMGNEKNQNYSMKKKIQTSLGAMIYDKVTVFSCGTASPWMILIITKVSPEGTAFTLPLTSPAITKSIGSILNKERRLSSTIKFSID